MRIGVIGVGRIGEYHARVMRDIASTTAMVVTDADATRARLVADRLGADAAPDVASLLARVDAVVIASPTDTHAALVRQAVDAGVPTFCEKPIALDLASTDDIVAHVERSGVTVQVGFQRRFDAGYRAAREAVDTGALGTVYTVRIVGHDPAPPGEHYIPGSGGIYRDLHIHDFDIARFVLGQDVTEVYATGAVLVDPMFARYGDIDTSAALLTFSDGTLGVLSGGRHDPLGYDIRMELTGARDSIAVGWDRRIPLRSVEPDMPGAPADAYRDFLDRFDAAYRAELDAFVDVARGRAPNPCTVQDAAAALRVAVACDRSRAERRPVRVADVSPADR